MRVEAVAVAVILALATLPLVVLVWRTRSRRLGLAAVAGWALGCLAAAGAGIAYRAGFVPELQVENRPQEVREDGYVSSRACQACHPEQYATWHASYHRSMTQIASPESVLAPFDGVRLGYKWTYQLGRLGDGFWIASDDPRWLDAGSTERAALRQVVMTTGSHHEQMYWISTGRGREVKLVPFVYRLREARWVPFHSIELTYASGPPQQLGQWNLICIRCHSTHGRPRAELQNGEPTHLDTKVAELGIACESCHGPGGKHVRLNRDPRRRYSRYLSDEPDPTIVQPANLSSRRASEVCGSCHSVHTFPEIEDVKGWVERGPLYRPGDELEKTRYLVRAYENPVPPTTRRLLGLDDRFLVDRFWPDGIVSAGGREYTAMMEAPCFKRGELSCLSCHTMHKAVDDPRTLSEWADDQLTPGMDGNEACLQCHGDFRTDLEAHTHHPEDSSGSKCYSCHMPNTTYGLMKVTRNHVIDSPDVRTTLATGRPNACNLCHLDRTLGWAADRLESWYGTPGPEALDPEDRSTARGVLEALRGDAHQRAIAAWHMGWPPAREASGSEWMVPILAQLLEDPYDAVRDIANRSLRSRPWFRDLDYDYLAPPPARAESAHRARRLWQDSEGVERRQDGRAVLLDGRGRLMEAEFARLLRERDDRPVYVVE